MAYYRRNFLPGGTFFFTINLVDRPLGLLVQHIDLLRAVVREVWAQHPFTIDACVVLPDHLHAIWTLPAGDGGFATRWRLIKGRFSNGLLEGERISVSRRANGERGIWQRRYWEHTFLGEDDFLRHLDYIHFNPVKHGHVVRVCDWPHSSFRRWLRLGAYPEDRAGSADDQITSRGE